MRSQSPTSSRRLAILLPLAGLVAFAKAPLGRASSGAASANTSTKAAAAPAEVTFRDAKYGALATKHHGTLHLSGSPAPDDVAALKAAGFVAVVDVRQAGEDRAALEAAARKAGLAYHNVPLLDARGAMDPNTFAAIGALHRRYGGAPHLVSCKSGNRSSAWYAAHLAKETGLPADAAVAAGRRAWLRDDMAAVVKAFLSP